MRPAISIAVPTSNMQKREYLFARLLDSLWHQTFQNFEVVITDNSDDSVIEKICQYYSGGIRYYRNPIKGMAQNTNEAIRRSTGELIKILYADDLLAHDKSLLKIINNFQGNWLVTSCTHMRLGNNYTQDNHTPHWSDDIHTGNNTIGSPSVLTILNDHPLMFDENMQWLLDADYYKRMYKEYGPPTILKDVNVILGLHPDQMTNTMEEERKLSEYNYMMKKYEKV